MIPHDRINEYNNLLGQCNKLTLEESITNKKRFTTQEDNLLRFLVDVFGTENWKVISKYCLSKTSRQCRKRYSTYLAPGIRHDDFSPDEDREIILKVQQFGPKWVEISSFFKGRSPNSLKNRYNVHIMRKKKISMEKPKKLPDPPKIEHEPAKDMAEDLIEQLWTEKDVKGFGLESMFPE